MRTLQTFALAATALTLAGCETLDGLKNNLPDFEAPWSLEDSRTTLIPQGECPAVNRVAELSSLYQFENPARPATSDEISEAHVTKVASTCGKQGSNLKVNIAISFDGALGPKARMAPGDKPTFTYPYFVAITDSQNRILSKEIFAVSFGYGATDNTQAQMETLSQVVPLGSDLPSSYRVLVGFQLSPEELTYNRKLPPEQLGKSTTVSTRGTASTRR